MSITLISHYSKTIPEMQMYNFRWQFVRIQFSFPPLFLAPPFRGSWSTPGVQDLRRQIRERLIQLLHSLKVSKMRGCVQMTILRRGFILPGKPTTISCTDRQQKSSKITVLQSTNGNVCLFYRFGDPVVEPPA